MAIHLENDIDVWIIPDNDIAVFASDSQLGPT